MTISLNGQIDQNNSSWQNEFLKTKLHEGVVNVRFIKKDGTERSMRCTLQSQYLPEQTTAGSERKENPDTLAVWDLEKEAWRSFRFDSVIGFSEEK